MESLEPLCAFAARGLKPDLMLWLDIPPEVGFERARLRGTADRIEQAGKEFHVRVYEGFRILAKSAHACRVDATQSISVVEQQAWNRIQVL